MDTGEVEAGVPFTRHSLDGFTGRILHLTGHFMQPTTVERLPQDTVSNMVMNSV